MSQLKPLIHQTCLKVLGDKRAGLEEQLRDLSESLSTEEKSPLGDKHETARARMQAEEQSLQKQLALLNEQLSVLERLDRRVVCNTVQEGACVVTDKGTFFISVPLGRLVAGEKEFYAITKDSPLGRVFLGASPGELKHFQQSEYRILRVC